MLFPHGGGVAAPLDERSPPCAVRLPSTRRDAGGPAPFLVEFRRGGDVAAYAEAYTGFLRAFSEPVVRAAFNHGGEAGTVEVCTSRMRARCWPSRSAARGAISSWPPC